MDSSTVQRLNELNKAFYAQTAPHFHETRDQAWQGWERLLPYLQPYPKLEVLDVGCGNGRFGRFLAENLTCPIHYHGIDSSAELLAYAEHDLKGKLAEVYLTEQDIIIEPPSKGHYTLVVLFGVLHHVPGAENRLQLMRDLAQRVGEMGTLAFACWRFYEYPRFRERIVSWGNEWQVEAHDYLLDWQRGTNALRYCHYVDDTEHQALAEATGLVEKVTYRADGKTNDLNRYSILQKDR